MASITIKGEMPEEWYKKRTEWLDTKLEGYAGKMHQWAFKNHRWENRSHDAELGLVGGMEVAGDKHSVYIAHTVPYGKELEKMADYRVCLPAMLHFLPDIRKTIKEAFSGRH